MNFEWLSGLSPTWGTIVHTVVYAMILGWVLLLPPREIYRDAPDRARWRNLRWWIVPLVLIQVGLYWVF